MTRSNPGKLLIGAGALTWAVAGAPKILALAAGRTALDERAWIWLGAWVAFALGFAVATTPGLLKGRTEARTERVALLVQSVAALVMLGIGNTGFEGSLLCVVAGEAPLGMAAGAALGWVIAQTAGMLVVQIVVARGDLGSVFFLSTAAYAAFQLFAFGAARLAASEAEARQEVDRIHAELLATQELFADSARTAERLRIARELHDALGHHLTALSLQLELARNVVAADGPAKEPVDQAHALTKELLGELRSVVGAMREDQPIDLAGALRTLASGIPRPRVHLEISPSLRVEPALAHAVFRCVQEALTNAVKHAGADNVYLAVEDREGTIAVSARDDGRGASLTDANVKTGHGLRGLRERVEGMGGSVEISARPGEGVTLRALLPSASRGGAS